MCCEPYTINYAPEIIKATKDNIISDCAAIYFKNEGTTDATLQINGSPHTITVKAGCSFTFSAEGTQGKIITRFKVIFAAAGVMVVLREYRNFCN